MKRLIALLIGALSLGWFSIQVQLSGHQRSGWLKSEYSGPFGFVRDSFLAAVQGVSADSRGLVAGLAIGDESLLSDQARDSMKVVSLTHLTAVSGANCAIVVGLAWLLLGRLEISRVIRSLVSIVVLAGYVLLVGPQPSVLRASVMVGVVIVSKTLGRKGGASAALALCIMVLLIADPWLVADYGFQLSVLATLGILQLAPALAERFRARMPTWLALTLAVSFAAQLFCLPVLLQLQEGLPTYSVLANVLAEPLVAPITVLGIVSCIVSPIVPWLAGLLTWTASLAAWIILQIASGLADAPLATLGWPSGLLGIACVVLVLGAVMAWARSQKAGNRFIAALVIGVAAASILGSCTSDQVRSWSWPPRDWSIVSCDVGQGDASVLRSNGAVAVIDVGREPRLIDKCLKSLGIKRIDLLVLTHFDLDHVGGLDGLLRNRQVGLSLITSYQDERPAAAITYRSLSGKSESVVQVGTGYSGKLGDLNWKVLSPHQGAAEAEDSNDGSVSMLFLGPKFAFLGLADLGERAQRRIAAESSGWLGVGFGGLPLVVKVAHHGSGDQYPELYEELRPQIALFSVGRNNDYGHPTERTLSLLTRVGSKSYRTDLSGALAISANPEGLQVYASGRG
ncbi:MAG: hypothetical protein RJA66_518 [Actinomycetota bacterium]